MPGVRWSRPRTEIHKDGTFQVASENWIRLTPLQNSWLDKGSNVITDGTEPAAAYYKDPWGWVHFQGRVGKTPGGAAIINEIICTLPVGYRPMNDVRFIVATGAIGAVLPSGLRINAAGELRGMASTGAAVNTNVSLSGISFRVIN